MTAFLSSLRIALRALVVNKMRSGLTMLGIIIGVAAVIAMVAVGLGAESRIKEQIASMGSNLLMVVPGSFTSGGMRFGAGTRSTLTVEDAKAIATEIPGVKYVAPVTSGSVQVVFGNQNWSTEAQGTTPEFLEIRNWSIASGRAFTTQEVESSAKVCILGNTLVENLFGGIHPVGEIVRIKKFPFTVVGVLDPKGQSGMGRDQDDIVFVPFTTAQRNLFGRDIPGTVRQISVQARGPEVLSEVEEQINTLLRQRHRILPSQENDFTVRNLTELMGTIEQTGKVMALLLASIASISLIVGGIGIMNIMLVSVTERTREIGIRIAVGAKGRDILLQFLIESLVLSLIGGILGIGIGMVGTLVLSHFTQWPTLFSVNAILLAFLFSSFVGIFFGFYPARKASLLNPIEALRYE
ncbi:MAG: ABC transporter permease [Thermodesulfobacteriota bacterium]